MRTRFGSVLQPYLSHLAAHAAEWWVAEDPSDGSLLGHARSVEREGLFELSELFVRPGAQSSGLGKRLIERAFPVGRGEVRLILATNDVRALARYYAADTVARFSMASLAAAPQRATGGAGDLEVVRATSDDTSVVAELEKTVVGFARHDDYPWLFEQREGYLYRRRGRASVSASSVRAVSVRSPRSSPPISAPSCCISKVGRTPAVSKTVSFQVPTINAVAMRHLLGRGFRIDAPFNLFMSNRSFGQFDRFVAFAPSIVL